MRFSNLFFVFLALLMMLAPSSYASEISERHDSLTHALNLAATPEEKIAVYNQLIPEKLFTDPVTSLTYSLNMLELAKSLEQKDYEAAAYSFLGVLYDLKGEYSLALNYHFKSLELIEELGFEQAKASCYTNISLIFQVMDKKQKAYDYQMKALEVFQQMGDDQGVMVAFNNLGILINSQGDTKAARKYYRETLTLNSEFKDPLMFVEIYKNIGKTYADESRVDSALYYYGLSMEAIDRVSDKLMETELHQYLASAHMEKYQLEKALTHARLSYQLAKEHQFDRELMMANKVLSSIYEKKNQFQQALTYHKAYSTLKDSLFNNQKEQAIAEAEMKYQNAQKEKTIALLDKDREIQKAKLRFHRLLNLSLLIGSVLLLGLVLFGSISILQKKRANQLLSEQQKALSEQNDELEDKNHSLKQLNEEKNSLISIVAHDLRSPLNEIQGLSELIRITGASLNDEQQHYNQMVIQSADRLNKMIANILDVEAIENKGIKVNPEVLELKALMEEVIINNSMSIDQKGVKVLLKGDSNVRCYADKSHTFQVFENLLCNAIKFSPECSEIELTVSLLGNKTRVAFKDQGPGISPEEQDLLFQKFQKLSAKPVGNAASTGLGLSIVEKYVKAMDGSVWCESELGKGATFFVELPVAASSLTPADQQSELA